MILASKVRAVLIERIKTRSDPKITYSDIGLTLNVQPRSKELRVALWLLIKDDYDARRPFISCLVVREDTKLPGQGFWIALSQILAASECKGFNIEEEYKKMKGFYGGDN